MYLVYIIYINYVDKANIVCRVIVDYIIDYILGKYTVTL